MASDFTYLDGDPHPADGENTDVRWFAVDALPEMKPHMLARIDAGLADEERARIDLATDTASDAEPQSDGRTEPEAR